eukprot:TRINITY_DN518_c0_g1_i2.p1 TRINITY_DN518_c0_g1~~TRINITY_DN518_c0_g1_i2.p1  ORF type:complete len:425 (-),score=68.47 TRINITY_DN518_c0_g1_i2:47-1321(-)
MNILGSFSDQKDDSYPTPQNAQFTDVDGAGALLNTNTFDYGPWDTDRCLFVNATSKQKYLLLSLNWAPNENVALDVKYWINAEIPLAADWNSNRILLDQTYSVSVMQRKWFYRDPTTTNFQVENLRLSVDRCAALPNEASATTKTAVAFVGILSNSWASGNTTVPVSTNARCFAGPKRVQSFFDSYYSKGPMSVVAADCAAAQVDVSDNAGSDLPTFFFARLRYGYIGFESLQTDALPESAIRVRLYEVPDYKDGGSRLVLPIRADSALLLTTFAPPVYDQELTSYTVYWSADSSKGAMGSFLVNSICYIHTYMNSSTIPLARLALNINSPLVTMTVENVFDKSQKNYPDSSIVLVTNTSGLFYAYDQTSAPSMDSLPSPTAPNSWPTGAIATAGALGAATAIMFIILLVVSCRKPKAGYTQLH